MSALATRQHPAAAIPTAEERGWALRDYQEFGREYLLARDRAGLLLDMGLGKTAICLRALEPRHLPALVVAPKRVAATVWPAEAAIWRPDLSVALAAGNPSTRARALASRAAVTVVGQDNLRDLTGPQNGRQRFRTLVLDELSGYKSRQSVRWKAARRIIARDSIPHVWGLTGTPTPNGLLDLWAQAYLLDSGERLGTTLTGYRSRYFFAKSRLPSGVVTRWEPYETSEAAIFDKLADLFLAMRTEGRVKLPPVTENAIEIRLNNTAAKIYRDLRDTLVSEVRDVWGENHTAGSAAILSSKLAQVTAGVLYPDDREIKPAEVYTRIHPAKTDALAEVVESADGSGVLVFYRFRAEAAEIRKKLGPVVTDINDRGAIERWNAGEVPVLLAHPKSAGHGLNLQHGGHTIVWTSLDWSPEIWRQANARLPRPGQQHPVVIHVIYARDTIDYRIRETLDDKHARELRLLDFLESPI